ncbi:hypothetical protein AVEN_219622-1 [Araneus ventricosus]|uniref:Uncharacterized protein n=1 Tax=Araneus ventricosus TaxID=182803 RepID=A0A4Y2LLR1_ARAVE|nr:hypothetical protein AVEN_219622-1 [Araneus ventricosus]
MTSESRLLFSCQHYLFSTCKKIHSDDHPESSPSSHTGHTENRSLKGLEIVHDPLDYVCHRFFCSCSYGPRVNDVEGDSGWCLCFRSTLSTRWLPDTEMKRSFT